MTKQLLVSSLVQKQIFDQLIRPEMKTGFWQSHRPAGHGSLWDDVEVVVSETDALGFANFTAPRLYNLVNPDFIKPNMDRLVAIAQQVKPSSTIKSVQKELIELSRIIGGRLTSKSMAPLKANRGNNKTTDNVIASAKVSTKKALNSVKKTAVKRKPVEEGVNIVTTSAGATVRIVSA
jgi:hypothetical protein